MRTREQVETILDQIGTKWDADNIESDQLDFKQTPTSKDSRAPEKFFKAIAESVVCFANADGGVLLIGVADKAATREDAIVGVDPVRWPLDSLVTQVFSRTTPSLTVQAQPISVDGRIVYAVEVPAGATVYGTTEGVYKVRVGDKCMPLEGEQLRGLRTLRQGHDWSAAAADAEWSDLSKAALEHAALLLSRHGNDEAAALALSDPKAFGHATGIATKDGEPTRAAVLLYGSARALAKIPEWGVNVQTRESPGGDGRVILRRDEVTVPLVLLIDQLITTVSALARTHVIRVGAEQIELVDYPPDALREVLANAFAHRDWEVPGVVEVIHSPEELSVASPGGLLPNLRPDRLLHDAASPRNPVLAAHMARLRIAEMSGFGFDRIFRAVGKLGKEPPILENGPRFRVIIHGGSGDEAFSRFLRSDAMPSSLSEDVDVLMVLTALRHSRSVTAADLSGRLQRDPAGVERVLRRMADHELIHPTRGTNRRAHPNYKLTPKSVAAMKAAVTYRTQTIDQDDQKLLRHLKRHGRITNEDVRNYLDCDMETARNRLTRLRKRGVIRFAPDSPTRGPLVEYALSEGKPAAAPPKPEKSAGTQETLF